MRADWEDNEPSFLEEAQLLYRELESEFPDRALIPFRSALIYEMKGDYIGAKKKMELAVNVLNHGQSIENGHWILKAARRHLAFYIWVRADYLKERDSIKPTEEENLLEVKKLLKEAITILLEADDFDVIKNDAGKREERWAASDLIDIVLDYVELNGDKCGSELMDLGVTPDRLHACLMKAEGGNLNQVQEIAVANAVRKCYKYFLLWNKAEEAAIRVLAIIKEGGISENDGADITRAYSEALGTLKEAHGKRKAASEASI